MNNNELLVMYGDSPYSMIPELLSKAGIADEIEKGWVIGLKPNLVVARESSSGATTDPDIVAAVIKYLKAKGLNNIVIMESSWLGDSTAKAYRVCGYQDISNRYNVPLIDLKKDQYQEVLAGDLNLKICKKALGVDYLINIPVLKAHCQTRITCALKNLKGCIPDSEKRRFHSLGLHKPIACLNKVLKSDLVIVDGIIGDLTFEEGGTPVRMNRIIVGKDPVLVDTYAAHLMGYDKEDIGYISIAEKLGVGSGDMASAGITEINKGSESKRDLRASNRVSYLAKYIDERDACSACYGSLIQALERLREKGRLKGLKTRVCIGQGFKGKTLDGIGVGWCTRGFIHFVPGCPPKAKDIINFIEDNIY